MTTIAENARDKISVASDEIIDFNQKLFNIQKMLYTKKACRLSMKNRDILNTLLVTHEDVINENTKFSHIGNDISLLQYYANNYNNLEDLGLDLTYGEYPNPNKEELDVVTRYTKIMNITDERVVFNINIYILFVISNSVKIKPRHYMHITKDGIKMQSSSAAYYAQVGQTKISNISSIASLLSSDVVNTSNLQVELSCCDNSGQLLFMKSSFIPKKVSIIKDVSTIKGLTYNFISHPDVLEDIVGKQYAMVANGTIFMEPGDAVTVKLLCPFDILVQDGYVDVIRI